MEFDYSALSGKIVEVFESRSNFAIAMDLSERTISLKMNNKRAWKNAEISKACDILNINSDEIPLYFFKNKVQET